MNTNKTILSIIITIIIFLCCLVWYKASRIKYQIIDIDQVYVKTGEVDYSLLHIGDIPKKDVNLLKKLMKDYNLTMYVSNTSISNAKLYLDIDINDDVEYVVFAGPEIVGTLEKNKEYEYYQEKLDKYVYHIIPDSELKLSVPDNAEEFIKDAEGKNYIVAVFGYSGCSYCTLYKPVLNEIVNDYGVKIYYFDSTTYDTTQYEYILNMGYEIPAKCTRNNEAVLISDSFASPMTLIIRNGKTVDCIKGNVSKDTVVSTLKKYKIIKEK